MAEMRHICGRHRDGCPKPHQFSVPVEQVGIDAFVPDGLSGGIVLGDGDAVDVKTSRVDAGLRRLAFTHRGGPRAYSSGDRVVREGWLVLPHGAET
jgi:hypothetical protein